MGRRFKSRRFTLVVLLAMALALLAGSPGASAHSDDGSIDAMQVSDDGRLLLSIDVRITFVGDGHPAIDAAATVVAEHADGSRVGPLPLVAAAQGGVYSARVPLPRTGLWTLRVNSLNPTASRSKDYEVAVDARSAPVVPSSTAPAAVATSSTTPASPQATSPVSRRAGGRENDQRLATTVLFVGILFAFAAAAGGLVRSSRRARREGSGR